MKVYLGLWLFIYVLVYDDNLFFMVIYEWKYDLMKFLLFVIKKKIKKKFDNNLEWFFLVNLYSFVWFVIVVCIWGFVGIYF